MTRSSLPVAWSPALLAVTRWGRHSAATKPYGSAHGERAACAGIERAQDLDRLQEGFAAAGGFERQPEEAWQVLAQRAVAGQHGVEVAACFQPFVGPAGNGCLDQGRWVLLVTERIDALRAIGRDQRVDGAEHAVQPVARPAAAGLALLFSRVARPPVRAGQEQVVHLDDLIEQRLARLDQVALDNVAYYRLLG